jgi:SPP1 gp7 family putative phage head morphogenesis protein
MNREKLEELLSRMPSSKLVGIEGRLNVIRNGFVFFSEKAVALAGRDGQRAGELLDGVRANGLKVMQELTEQAVRRLLADDDPLNETTLFNADELVRLQDSIASAIAAGDMLGRSRVRRLAEHYTSKEHAKPEEHGTYGMFRCNRCGGVAFDGDPTQGLRYRGSAKCVNCGLASPARSLQRIESYSEDFDGRDPQPFETFDEAIPAMSPTHAVEYFRRLVPAVDVNPERYGRYLDRRAFTLAVDADEVLLDKIKKVILEQLQTGQNLDPVGDLQIIMDKAGVTPKNPQYADLVYRTNMMDAYVQGQQHEYGTPEMQEMFPAWEYHAVPDERSRPHHAARNGLLYPSVASFQEVRGTDASDVINCRCGFSPIHRRVLERRMAAGERVQENW